MIKSMYIHLLGVRYWEYSHYIQVKVQLLSWHEVKGKKRETYDGQHVTDTTLPAGPPDTLVLIVAYCDKQLRGPILVLVMVPSAPSLSKS
jgi:hypothetical protein